jgi:hypothetical protein
MNDVSPPTCARCGRTAPWAPQAEDGWVFYEEPPTLVIAIPWEDDFALPEKVLNAIPAHEGGVVCNRLGPEITRAEVLSRDLGR